MKTTDTSEKGLETIIVNSLVNEAGYVLGDPKDYDREHAVDLVKLLEFLETTQPDTYGVLGINREGPKRTQFLHRLQGEIAKRGVVDALQTGIRHGPAHVELFYGTPTPGNVKAVERFSNNIFSVTRQLRYSSVETALSLDMAVFINGLPIATFELKNRLTKQTVLDAVEQYQRDRDPKELLLQFGRCAVHFAVDDHEVRFCTHLTGKGSWFLPFNKGHNDGAGNPPNPNGIATDYLWKEVLTKEGLTDILENYAQIVEEKDEKTCRKKLKQVFPRYHQLTVVRQLLATAKQDGVGKRYLIQHSAGSGKSNSIAWLAHQLVGLEQDGKALFDSIIVVTDRQVLDRQIRNTIKQFAQVSATVGHAERSGDLRQFIKDGKKVIITTVQKFPFILNEIGDEHRQSKFAIVIDEAHSSQGGKTTAAMNRVLEGTASYNVANEEEEETTEDKINRILEGRKMVTNASYFAFTATPKNKTLEIFGQPAPQPDGTVKHYPFHSYTMKQAIQEGFILDVLKSYTPVESYYRLAKTVEDDPLFDAKKAQKKLRRYVESHQHAIREKTEIMVDHFHTQVINHGKIGGQARAMVITNGIGQAIQYFYAFKDYLRERKSPYQAIVAFSGEYDYGGQKVTEATLNGFPSSQITDKIEEDPYRFLIVADKYQTGYDQPLLHTMYVDKALSGIKAVQTLSRLNRAHPQKYDTFVLDFYNDSGTIQSSFDPYYRTTILSNETDPNKLHDLKADLDSHQVYTQEQIQYLVELYLNGADRDRLDPVLDACVAAYNADLDEDGQVDFKGKAKAFVRTYGFLASILPYSNADWEKLSIFLNFLIPKLPAPKEEDLSRGILEAIDMDSYRVELKTSLKIDLADEDAEIKPVPTAGGGSKPEADLDQLSNIIKAFNDQFGNINWKDNDKIRRVIAEEIPAKVAADVAYQNAMRNNDKRTARIEHDAALQRVMIELLADHTELFKQFSDNQSFKKWLGDTIFGATYRENWEAG
ncbi:type I site-specific deoxyribonuclease chain R (plasmid) [Synechocystis sp. PCC 6803]|uniref:Type I site-specific deoxyribonuclease chain R n=1 Tax=Synechocystis sp. (strain ATCC 27184 / PCC 6803 / Kazusa) TaxID=1111708 RepID=Q6ZE43_SYNY3|nr:MULTISPECIES: type I restriction endonuclease subunit R [unclassified Synechocystis]AGF53660.1 type I site-specific deoxyribonuclease chain R [Synechocystis sp. PCC 6803]AVP91554.1 type I restriction endonuclease subunit R [Synechocystis sp. IPPAS B-1465]MBD2619674.1 type I restriction endonuclease subunit R [Synechocystis sp. FACHB-898]MBD2640748.1 type I restriction endonuclease subunit R [Synechocystis sp. FACHB-908]MBD2662389.1 type I restriction endonuclease subunit R [Synechocystis sp